MLSRFFKTYCISLYPDETGQLQDDCDSIVDSEGDRCDSCWDLLVESSDMRLRLGVASDPALPQHHLEKLAADPVAAVARAVAPRDLTIQQATLLSNHPSERVLYELARYTPYPVVQNSLFNMRSKDTIIGMLLKNPALDRQLNLRIIDLNLPDYTDAAKARLNAVKSTPLIAGV